MFLLLFSNSWPVFYLYNNFQPKILTYYFLYLLADESLAMFSTIVIGRKKRTPAEYAFWSTLFGVRFFGVCFFGVRFFQNLITSREMVL